MPWMAARARVRGISRSGLAGLGARLPGLAAAGVLAACIGPLVPAASAEVSVTEYLPSGQARTLDDGPAGWSASAQVTAVGCGASGCPQATGDWVAGAGSRGPGDGALEAKVTGLAGQAGVATVTWRSPAFLAPLDSEAQAFSIASQAVSTESAPAGASSVKVSLAPFGGLGSRTVVEYATPTFDGSWTPGPRRALAPGALPLGSLHRLEVEATFPFDSAARGARLLRFDLPTIDVRRTFEPPTGDPGPEPSQPDPAVSEPVGSGAAQSVGGQLAACGGEEVVVLGAAAANGRIALSGVSSRAAGSRVDLISADGWALGRTTVGPSGTFALRARQPNGSQRIGSVRARLADGEQSPVVRVGRDNVLESVRQRGGTVTVAGVLGPRARARRSAVAIVIPGADPCGPGQIVHATSQRVDRRSGRYRASAPVSAAPAGTAEMQPFPVIRAQVTTWGPGLPRRVTTSQPILGAPSGIALRRPG